MYKIIRSYKYGYEEGIKDAYRDYLKNKEKKFKFVNKILLLSKLYDYGYIDGYRKFINYLFNLKIK